MGLIISSWPDAECAVPGRRKVRKAASHGHYQVAIRSSVSAAGEGRTPSRHRPALATTIKKRPSQRDPASTGESVSVLNLCVSPPLRLISTAISRNQTSITGPSPSLGSRGGGVLEFGLPRCQVTRAFPEPVRLLSRTEMRLIMSPPLKAVQNPSQWKD